MPQSQKSSLTVKKDQQGLSRTRRLQASQDDPEERHSGQQTGMFPEAVRRSQTGSVGWGLQRVNGGSRYPTDPESLSEIVRTLFRSGSVKESTQHETAPTWEIEEVTEPRLLKQDAACRTIKPKDPTQCPTEQ